MPEAVVELNRQELIRDWELGLWRFLLFGLGRLFWLYVAGAANRPFQLEISCGFLFCDILGFLMRWVVALIEKQKEWLVTSRRALPGPNLYRSGEAQRNRNARLRLWLWRIALGSVQSAAPYLARISFGVR
ncbi:MAG TPA: hypothetical protein VN577_01600 [Terriglobales bacterium]|nr:hypothetical protein [Terriglobales bacterium]